MFNRQPVTGKPKNPSEAICPLMRGPCATHCHNCEWWQSLEATVNGKPETMWKCAMNWGVTLHSVNNGRLDGLQRAFESLRNQFAKLAAVALFKQLPQPDAEMRVINPEADRAGDRS